MKKTLTTLAALALFAGAANAADITYVGNQIDIETYANTLTEGWRNTTPAKPLDADGDHILGTDGWWTSGSKSNPSYATVTKEAAGGGGWGPVALVDNPADPSGDDIGMKAYYDWGYSSSRPFVTITIDSNLDGKVLRLGVLYGAMSWARTGITYTLSQTFGGNATATSPSVSVDGNSVNVLFFDITGAAVGDEFVVTAYKADQYHEFAGVTLDSVTPVAPELVALSPAHTGTDVALLSDLVITFDRAIQKGTGNIVIWDMDAGAQFQSINVTTSAVTTSDTNATITHSAFTQGTTYQVTVPSGAFQTLSLGVDFAGIDGANWEFTATTTLGDPPQVAGLSPLDNAVNVSILTDLEITFDQGNQVDIESPANDPTFGWRNTTPAKPLDIDGDHILGTDGWFLGHTQSNPPYATATMLSGHYTPASPGKLDNPADPSGTDTVSISQIFAGITEGNRGIRFVINGSGLDGKILRVGVLGDIYWAGRTYSFTLRQTVGGAVIASATSPNFVSEVTAMDVALFDITGAKDGDTFVINTPSGAGEQLAGITFDTVSNAAWITSFEAAGVTGVIDQGAKTIAVEVPFGTNLATLAPTFTLSSGTCNQTSGAVPSPNFAAQNPVDYVVTDTATDPDTVNTYSVTVTVGPEIATLVINLGTSPAGTAIEGGAFIGSGPTNLPLPAVPAGSILKSIAVDAALEATDNGNYASDFSLLIDPTPGTPGGDFSVEITNGTGPLGGAALDLNWPTSADAGPVTPLIDTKTDADWAPAGLIDLSTTGLFLGNAFQNGGWTSPQGGTWSGTITLTYEVGSGGSAYSAWAGGEPFAGDANGDGVSNGMAFLLGAADVNANALGLLPTPTEDGSGGLVMTFTMLDSASRGAAALSVEHSGDLGSSDAWAAVLVPDTTQVVGGVDFQVSGSGTLNVIATIPESGNAIAGKLFGRLVAEE